MLDYSDCHCLVIVKEEGIVVALERLAIKMAKFMQLCYWFCVVSLSFGFFFPPKFVFGFVHIMYGGDLWRRW